MTDTFDDLKNVWKDSKGKNKKLHISADEIIETSKIKMRKIVIAHIGNIGILTTSLIGIIAFFIFVAPFNETLSHIGMGLMIGGLAIRILIELSSIYRSNQVDMSESAVDSNDSEFKFYQYRKQIHGPVTYTLLVAYSVGFYLLSPEFSQYISTGMMILMDVSYVFILAMIVFFIRKGTREEVKYLEELSKLRTDLIAT